MLTAAATIRITDHPDGGAQRHLPFQWQNVQFEPALQDDPDALAEFSESHDLGRTSLHHRRTPPGALEIPGEWM